MRSRTDGFSLIEVALALGIAAFALVAIIGLFPVGLGAARASVDETRAGQIAEQIFATLRNQPFDAVNLYGNPIDLGPLETTEWATPSLELHADGDGRIVETAADAAYTIGLRFHRTLPDSASEVHIAVSPNLDRERPIRFVSVISRY